MLTNEAERLLTALGLSVRHSDTHYVLLDGAGAVVDSVPIDAPDPYMPTPLAVAKMWEVAPRVLGTGLRGVPRGPGVIRHNGNAWVATMDGEMAQGLQMHAAMWYCLLDVANPPTTRPPAGAAHEAGAEAGTVEVLLADNGRLKELVARQALLAKAAIALLDDNEHVLDQLETRVLERVLHPIFHVPEGLLEGVESDADVVARVLQFASILQPQGRPTTADLYLQVAEAADAARPAIGGHGEKEEEG